MHWRFLKIYPQDQVPDERSRNTWRNHDPSKRKITMGHARNERRTCRTHSCQTCGWIWKRSWFQLMDTSWPSYKRIPDIIERALSLSTIVLKDHRGHLKQILWDWLEEWLQQLDQCNKSGWDFSRLQSFYHWIWRCNLESANLNWRCGYS